MPFESILFLGIVFAALAVFTVTVAYGQWVTRGLDEAGSSTDDKPVKISRAPASARSSSAARVYEKAL